MERTRLNEDMLSGLLFIVCGAFGFWIPAILPPERQAPWVRAIFPVRCAFALSASA